MAVVGGRRHSNFQTTFPSMVRFGFDRGAGAVGTAMSVSAIGSILGGIWTSPASRRTLVALSPLRSSASPAALLVFAAAPSYPAFVVLSIPLGFVLHASSRSTPLRCSRRRNPRACRVV